MQYGRYEMTFQRSIHLHLKSGTDRQTERERPELAVILQHFSKELFMTYDISLCLFVIFIMTYKIWISSTCQWCNLSPQTSASSYSTHTFILWRTDPLLSDVTIIKYNHELCLKVVKNLISNPNSVYSHTYTSDNLKKM
jgi:hypothetical protein